MNLLEYLKDNKQVKIIRKIKNSTIVNLAVDRLIPRMENMMAWIICPTG